MPKTKRFKHLKFCPTAKLHYIVGIDEVGRGPLAGPVTIGAVVIRAPNSHLLFKDIKNSKLLPPNKREEWFSRIKLEKKSGTLDYKVSSVSHSIIDKKGIVKAVKIAIYRALHNLGINPRLTLVLLDGSLKAPDHFLFQQTIIGGDEKVPIISLASIVAKVVRDRKMVRLAKEYPNYDFQIHKGYGTLLHRKKIKSFGPCKIHRRSFLRKILSRY